MQKETKCYLGIDVSKLWFDISLMIVADGSKQPMQTERFDNNEQGLDLLDMWLQAHNIAAREDTLLVIENTGVYHRLIWQYCSDKALPLHIGNAAQIKWSLGITRGKDDVTDSRRLCAHCYRHADELKPTAALPKELMQLKDLSTMRSQMLSRLTSIKVQLNELKLFNDKNTQREMEEFSRAALEGINKSLKQIEQRIAQLIQQVEPVRKNYELLLSVPGIGPVTATYLICCTDNFASGISGKQLASYAGVAPFGSSSGSSVRGRDKVHKMANKDLKKLLHMGAMSAIRYHPEFEAYYERKKKEGKHSMSILNAIRNKIALRVVAVIKNQTKYVDNYATAA